MLPRLVVLDGYCVNPGDLSFREFEALAQVSVHPRSGDAVLARAADAELLLTNKERLDAERIAALPKLKYIGVLATGVNVVDLDAARERGVAVTNVPGYGAASVAQHVFALLLELNNRARLHSAAVGQGTWSASPDFCFTLGGISELAGRRFGVVGLGEIGQRAASIAAAFGMTVAASTLQRSRPGLPGVPIEWLSTEALFETCDVISLHCPLTPETRHLVNAERLRRMQAHAILINTGRGDLVDEAALLDALLARRLGGAGLDVLSQEPPATSHVLLQALARDSTVLSEGRLSEGRLSERLLITPHMAWATREARQRLLSIAAGNLRAFLKGERQNRVD